MLYFELQKDRKTIPCYWENKIPHGCKKTHCPFNHLLDKYPKKLSELDAEITLVKPFLSEWSIPPGEKNFCFLSECVITVLCINTSNDKDFEYSFINCIKN
jgi:hypothetical protein